MFPFISRDWAEKHRKCHCFKIWAGMPQWRWHPSSSLEEHWRQISLFVKDWIVCLGSFSLHLNVCAACVFLGLMVSKLAMDDKFNKRNWIKWRNSGQKDKRTRGEKSERIKIQVDKRNKKGAQLDIRKGQEDMRTRRRETDKSTQKTVS